MSHVVSTFVSYALEKRFSRHPERFGKGAIEGVAGPETANNATTGTAMIPLLALGIPSIPATAILLSALTIHGVQPGPLLLTDHPQVFWGLVASMYIGNVVLLILNLPLVGIFVNLLRIPYGWLVPIILVISVIGVYSVNFKDTDIWIMVLSGGVGYLLRKFGYEMAPLLLALVLGDRMEENFRLALTMSGGSYATFADQASLIVLASALSCWGCCRGWPGPSATARRSPTRRSARERSMWPFSPWEKVAEGPDEGPCEKEENKAPPHQFGRMTYDRAFGDMMHSTGQARGRKSWPHVLSPEGRGNQEPDTIGHDAGGE